MILAFGISALAQSNKGTVVGTVKDPNGALVAGSRVTMVNLATGDTREASSGDDGNYTITSLEPGKYRVSADATGFQSVVFEEITVETNQRLPLDINFASIAGATGTVTVNSDAAPMTESESSVRGDVITGRQVTE